MRSLLAKRRHATTYHRDAVIPRPGTQMHDRERTKQSMAVKMRLRREGKRKQPFYRVVVADARSPRDGRFIEDIGYYQPLRDPSEIAIDRDRALYWLGEGVQPSDAVRQLLRVTGIWEEFRPGDPGRQRSRPTAATAASSAPKQSGGDDTAGTSDADE